MNKTTSPIRKKRKQDKVNPLVLVLLTALVIVAIAGVAVFFSGYRYISMDGIKYSGFVKDGQPVDGTVKYPDGVSGKLTKDKNSAQGKIVYSDGSVYEGDLNGFLRHGKGVFTLPNGEIHECEFVNDSQTGYALCKGTDGTVYEGMLLDGKKEGVGKAVFPDGSYYYGEWKNNMRNGTGEERWADGSYYYGSYVDDKRSGNSVVTVNLENGGKYTGENMYVFTNGNKYVGDFLNDRRHGEGVFTWASGPYYEGSFVNDKRHGNGTYHYGDGRSYTGEFKEDKIVPEQEENTDDAE